MRRNEIKIPSKIPALSILIIPKSTNLVPPCEEDMHEECEYSKNKYWC